MAAAGLSRPPGRGLGGARGPAGDGRAPAQGIADGATATRSASRPTGPAADLPAEVRGPRRGRQRRGVAGRGRLTRTSVNGCRAGGVGAAGDEEPRAGSGKGRIGGGLRKSKRERLTLSISYDNVHCRNEEAGRANHAND